METLRRQSKSCTHPDDSVISNSSNN